MQEHDREALCSSLPYTVFVQSESAAVNQEPLEHCWPAVLKRFEHLMHQRASKSAAANGMSNKIYDEAALQRWEKLQSNTRQEGEVLPESEIPALRRELLDRIFHAMRISQSIPIEPESLAAGPFAYLRDAEKDDEYDAFCGTKKGAADALDGAYDVAWLRDFARCVASKTEFAGRRPIATIADPRYDEGKMRLAQLRVSGTVCEWLDLLVFVYQQQINANEPLLNWLHTRFGACVTLCAF